MSLNSGEVSTKVHQAAEAILKKLSKTDQYGDRYWYSKRELHAIAVKAVGSITNDEYSQVIQHAMALAIEREQEVITSNRMYTIKG